ncbi:MAG: hypothetical protein ACTSXY_12215 [Promethearchaeota archaeon]
MTQKRANKLYILGVIVVIIVLIFLQPFTIMSGMSFSDGIPDGDSHEIRVYPQQSFVWNITEKSLTEYSYLEKWDIISNASDGLFANIYSSSDAIHWSSIWTNLEIIYIYPGNNGFSIHKAGPNIVPMPLNATNLVLQIEGTYASFVEMNHTTWMWDGHVLKIWNDFVPDFGDTLENYYLEAWYDSDGVLTLWNETYSISGQSYQVLTTLISRTGSHNVDASDLVELNFPTFNNMTPSLSVATKEAVNFSISTSSSTPLNNTPDQSILFLELNCSDQSKVKFSVTLSILYTDEALQQFGLTVNEVAFWYFNQEGSWEQLNTKCFPNEKRIEVELSHFSTYALAKGTPEIIESRSSSTPGYPIISLFSISLLAIGLIILRSKRSGLNMKG